MKVSLEIDPTTGTVRVEATWTLREQQEAAEFREPVSSEENHSVSADVLADTEHMIRRIVSYAKARAEKGRSDHQPGGELIP